jgi:hypothetical protein
MTGDDKAARAAFAKLKAQLHKVARTDPQLTPSARALAAAVLDRNTAGARLWASWRAARPAERRPCARRARVRARRRRLISRLPPAGILSGMNDLLDALDALRPLWVPLLVVSLAAGAGLALIAWG